MQRVQERLCAICAVLADMKATKLLGLGETVLQTVTSLREVEVGASQGYRVLLMWSLFIGMSSYTVLSPEYIT
jgi:ATP-binding cassette subfamily C (CFTR/MRP) protein 1